MNIKKMLFKNMLIFIALFFYSYVLSEADNVSFTASVDKNPVAAGDQLQLTLTLTEATGTDFKQPNFGGLQVLMGPSTMRQQQIINGQRTSSISYTYVLLTEKPGKYTIGPATINVNGKKLQTNSVTLTVQKESSSGNQQKTITQQANSALKDKIFIRASVNKRNVYQGEQLIATYKLYYSPQVQISGVNPSKEPAFTGFWTQNIDVGNSPATKEVVNGVTYNTKEIKKVVLVPQQTGELTIEPLEYEFIIALPVRDGWWTTYQNFPQKVASARETINVNPLPQANKPPDFKGAVGEMKFSASLDKYETRTNEPVTLKVQISGNGNLKLIEPLTLNLPPDIENFEPKVTENISVSSGGITGSKSFEYLLIPRHEGEYKITPASFSYYDLGKREYIRFTSQDFNLKVAKGDASAPVFTSGNVNKEDVKILGKDIRFIKNTQSNLKLKGSRYYGSLSFILLTIVPLLLFIILFFYRKKQLKMSENFVLLKNKKATRIANKRLKIAQKYLTKGEANKFYEEITKALWGYLSDKFGIPPSDLTKDKATEILQKLSIPDELIVKFLEMIDNCEFARFAPASVNFEMNHIYNEAVGVITNMEGALK